MRKWYLALTVVLVTGAATTVPAGIEPDALLEHIRFLASDELMGRGNGSDELEVAAEYIAHQFADAGLEPGSDDGFFQPFELVAGLTVGSGNHLAITAGTTTVRFALGSSYYPLSAPANEDATLPSTSLHGVPLVFAGYGLSILRLKYDDYAGLDVRDKAVLIFSHEPQEHDARSRFNGTRPVSESSLQEKAAAARSRGALALLVVSDPTHAVDEANYTLFGLDPEAEDHGIPVLRIRRTDMKPLIEAWGLDDIARQIDRDLQPRSRPLEDAVVDYVEYLAHNRQTVRNVVGLLPGSDPARAGEAIVIGAHYDHVGVGGRFSVAPERTGEIHNGADDNASGTAAIIEMARTAAAQRHRFPRTLVFIAFAGEERGLLGSAHYTREPAVPLGRTVAMLNLDMIGRANGSVDVSGIETAPSLEADLQAAIAAGGNGLRVRREGPGAGRSDDWSFITRRIPAINFFTGFHGDYHRPDDTWDKIDVPGTRQVAALALELAAQIAARPDRPEFRSR